MDEDMEADLERDLELDDDDEQDEQEDQDQSHDVEQDQDNDRDLDHDLDMDDDQDQDQSADPEEEPVPVTRIEVEIPKISNELGNEIHFVKLPNFLSVDTHPYDPSWYEDEIDEDEILDEEGRARLKLKVESTIRWRTVVDEDGNSKRESNARVIKWSDGSMSLHLGSEIFDIHKQSLMVGDNNHLFIRQGTGLQGQAIFKTKLTFRPHSTDSFTHRKMTLSLAERSHKTQKIRVLPNVGKDPEAHRSEMIKKEEDKLKASIRRENKMKRIRERAPYSRPTAQYLENENDEDYDDDEDEGTSIKKIKDDFKNKIKDDFRNKKLAPKDVWSSDNDDDDFDTPSRNKESRKKATKVIEDSDEDD